MLRILKDYVHAGKAYNVLGCLVERLISMTVRQTSNATVDEASAETRFFLTRPSLMFEWVV